MFAVFNVKCVDTVCAPCMSTYVYKCTTGYKYRECRLIKKKKSPAIYK